MMIRTGKKIHKTTSFYRIKDTRTVLSFQYLNYKTIIIYDLKNKVKSTFIYPLKQFDIDNQMNTFAEVTSIEKQGLKKVA